MMKSITILLALVLAGINDTSAETSLRALSHQRRDLSAVDWWYSLLNALHVPCPHHDEEKGHCAHHSHHHSGGGGAAAVVEAVVVEAVEAARIPTPTAPSNVTMMMPTACCAQLFARTRRIVIRPCAAQMFLSAVTTVPMVLMNMV